MALPNTLQYLGWNEFAEPLLPASDPAINQQIQNYNLFCEPFIANNTGGAVNSQDTMFVICEEEEFI